MITKRIFPLILLVASLIPMSAAANWKKYKDAVLAEPERTQAHMQAIDLIAEQGEKIRQLEAGEKRTRDAIYNEGWTSGCIVGVIGGVVVTGAAAIALLSCISGRR